MEFCKIGPWKLALTQSRQPLNEIGFDRTDLGPI
jgi:hypothetical protein